MERKTNTKGTSEKKIITERRKKKVNYKDNLHSAADVRSKVDSFTITMRSLREMAENEAKLVQHALKNMDNNIIDPKHILDLTKSIHSAGERSVTEYITRNTEILLNKHASVIRQQVIENMKQQMKEMSDELTFSTQKLENNISNFFELIETSYESASQSFHKVIALAQENYDKEEEINKTKDELFLIQSEVQELEKQLLECLMCYAFLDFMFPFVQKDKKLILPEVDIQCKLRRSFLKYESKAYFLKSFCPFSDSKRTSIQKKILEDVTSSGDQFDPLDVKVESVTEIVKVIDRLKNSNLSLVHNSNLSKESLKFERKEVNEAKQKMEEDLTVYEAKITTVKEEIEKTKEIQKKLKKQLRDIQEEYAKDETAMQRGNEIKKLSELYSLCTGSNAKNVDISLMKVSIDHFLEDLMHELNKYPKKKVKEVFRVLEVEKKLSEKKVEEALRAERLEQRLLKRRSASKTRL